MKSRLSLDQKDRLIQNASKYGDIDALMIRNWIRDLNFIVDKISKNETNHSYIEGTFWIRIFGLLTEVRDNFEYVAQKILPLLDRIRDPKMRQVILLTGEIYNEIKKIISNLTDDEHLIIDYLRQTNCHVLQKGYRLGVKNLKGEKIIKQRYTISSNKKTLTIDEIDHRLDLIFRSYNTNQWLIARDICIKIQESIYKIYSNSEIRSSL